MATLLKVGNVTKDKKKKKEESEDLSSALDVLLKSKKKKKKKDKGKDKLKKASDAAPSKKESTEEPLSEQQIAQKVLVSPEFKAAAMSPMFVSGTYATLLSLVRYRQDLPERKDGSEECAAFMDALDKLILAFEPLKNAAMNLLGDDDVNDIEVLQTWQKRIDAIKS